MFKLNQRQVRLHFSEEITIWRAAHSHDKKRGSAQQQRTLSEHPNERARAECVSAVRAQWSRGGAESGSRHHAELRHSVSSPFRALGRDQLPPYHRRPPSFLAFRFRTCCFGNRASDLLIHLTADTALYPPVLVDCVRSRSFRFSFLWPTRLADPQPFIRSARAECRRLQRAFSLLLAASTSVTEHPNSSGIGLFPSNFVSA